MSGRRARSSGVVLLFPVLDFGGVESLGVIQATEMRATDMRVAVLEGGGAAEEAIRAVGVPVDRLTTSASIRNPLATWHLWRYLRRHHPAIVHARTGAMTLHGLLAARLAGVPVRIVEEVGIPARGRVGRLVFPWLYRLASAVVAVSDSVAAHLVTFDGVPPEKVHRIYNAIDRRYFDPMPRAGGARFRVLSVGRLVPVKGFDVLIEAMAPMLRDSDDLVLTIAGEGPERDRLRCLSMALGIESSVELLGFRSDVAELLATADAFVLPSRSEGFALALVEAAAAKVPIIATRVGGVPEVLPPWASEWLVPPGDPAALSAAVERLCAMNDDERAEIAARLHDFARQRFGPDQYVANLRSLYAELLERAGVRE